MGGGGVFGAWSRVVEYWITWGHWKRGVIRGRLPSRVRLRAAVVRRKREWGPWSVRSAYCSPGPTPQRGIVACLTIR